MKQNIHDRKCVVQQAWYLLLLDFTPSFVSIIVEPIITLNVACGFQTDGEKSNNRTLVAVSPRQNCGRIIFMILIIESVPMFVSHQEFPFVRYRAAKALDSSTMTTFRDLVPTKLAAAIWNCITTYKSTIPNFPKTETCELLILDRSVDQIAPVIHEWTYDAMCHDLVAMDGNKYVHEIPSKTGGQPEKKEVLLEDHDPVWLELRHAHIADASERLHDKMTNFVSKNKAAQLQQRLVLVAVVVAIMVAILVPWKLHITVRRITGILQFANSRRDGSELSTRDLQKMVQALPQYNEQMEKLSLHVEIAGKINRIIREMGLRELGQLEQDIVFGDAGTKEIINFLRTKQESSSENKLRLLMIYASVYPEKFEGDKASKLMQLAKLSQEDMKAVKNMRMLEGSKARKTSTGSFSLKFDAHMVNINCLPTKI
ncbi:STXBP unc-18 S1 [Sarracenia purpurea var. burkii]